MIRLRIFLIALLFASVANIVQAQTRKQATWQWQLASSSFGESYIAFASGKNKLGTIEIACDLSDYNQKNEQEDPVSTIIKVKPQDFPDGLLVVICSVGAHSRMINVIDPLSNPSQPLFSKTGSYIADWVLRKNQLIVRYDQPCEKKQASDCEIPFETVEKLIRR